MTDKDIIFMGRAMELAENGRGNVSPNPMVGCVIVHREKVIGEGWHMHYGKPHAEVNAINAVVDKSLISESTVYVTLEPCSHFGKTPPCADLLLQHKANRIVISNTDPNPLVAGKGIKLLKEAGAKVETGVLEEKGKEINKRFFLFHDKKRPYIILKWAQTSDGFIAKKNYDSKWISNAYSRQLVHRWRSEEDAILVGKNTALYDNPQLTVRDAAGKNPVRLVLDPNLELPKTLSLFDGSQLTICYNLVEDESLPKLEFKKLSAHGIEEGILRDLYERNIQSLLIEGGSALLQSFIDKGFWDEARIFRCSQTFGKGIPAPTLRGGTFTNTINIVGDSLEIYQNG